MILIFERKLTGCSMGRRDDISISSQYRQMALDDSFILYE